MKQGNFAVEKYLKRNKEVVLVDLRVSNYSKSNFYLGVVYNKKINMYKVLYIPLDLVDDGRIEDFACYQFIDTMSVDYILSSLKTDEDKYKEESFRNRENELINNYKVCINVNVGSNNYQFKTTRFIPKDWVFMFDLIVTIFSYAPNIVSGLCEDLLTLFKDESEDIKYQESFEFNILRDDEDILYKVYGTDLIDFKKISYLERINNKYFSIISGHIVIIDYEFGITNTYCECEEYKKYVLTVIMAIRNNVEKKFNKIMIMDKDKSHKVKYYLAYGVNSKGIKVIHGCREEIILYSDYKEGLIKFREDVDNLEETIKKKI